MNKTEQYILERLDNLERAFLMSQRRNVDNTFKAENAENIADSNIIQIQENSSEIADTREGLIETFDVAMTNAGDVADCREAIIELYDMISE